MSFKKLVVSSPMPSIDVKIYASVHASITLDENESAAELKKRFVDIYLHGAVDRGYADKIDLGADFQSISLEPEDDMVIANKGLFLALLDTARRNMDLDSIYDDQYGTSYDWDDLPKLVSGLLSEDLDRFKPV